MTQPRQQPRHKVLINAVHAKSGGGITYLANILPWLAAQPDLDIEIAIQSDQTGLKDTILAGFAVHVLPKVSAWKTVFWQEQTAIPRLARRIGARVVFSPANYGPVFGRGNVLLLRNAFEVASLEKRLSKRLYWLAVRVMTEISFRASARAIAVSRHAGDNFLKVFGMAGDPRLDVVHHGVSPAFSPPTDDAGRRPHHLAAVSDIYVQKNLETLLRAVAKVKKSTPDVRLLIAGRPLDPDYYARMQALSQALGLRDTVVFLGGLPQDKVAELYRQAEVFVFPSLVETFGNPLLEAMASGIPVVCSDAAALPEVAGQAALYARPGDADDMAAKITTLFQDKDLWHRLSAAGLERAGQFTWERCAKATARVLLDVALRG
jgi:glycosyltransferase involved in cell wall biosynthesis